MNPPQVYLCFFALNLPSEFLLPLFCWIYHCITFHLIIVKSSEHFSVSGLCCFPLASNSVDYFLFESISSHEMMMSSSCDVMLFWISYCFCDIFFRATLTWSVIRFGLLFSPLLIIVSPWIMLSISVFSYYLKVNNSKHESSARGLIISFSQHTQNWAVCPPWNCCAFLFSVYTSDMSPPLSKV